MRLLAASLMLLALPLLAACDSGTPPAKAPAATPAASTPAVKAPAAAAKPVAMPAGARPLLGTWATDLAGCDSAAAVTTITATSYSSGGKSCDMTLADNKDGSFTASCGGAQISLVPVFAPSGEGINIKVGDGKKVTVLRCSR